MDASEKKRREMSGEIAAFARAHQKTKASGHVIVVSHRDCDAVEPAHIENADAMERDLRQSGVLKPVAATPAWEIETWWMPFPEALNKTRGCWKRVDYSRRNVGLIENSKNQLIHDLRPDAPELRAKCRDYKEEDSIKISNFIRTDFEPTAERTKNCKSLGFFLAKITKMIDDANKSED